MKLYMRIILAGIACALAFESGRLSVVQDTSCPFDFEDMTITPQTPTAYHHITGRRAPKHGVAVPHAQDWPTIPGTWVPNVPLPPRRPAI